MSKTDDFDEFLQRGFGKSKNTIADEGFSQRVISKLPVNRIPLINRKFILYLSSASSVFLFFISNGYKPVFLSIIDIFNNGFHWMKPSLTSFFVLLVFISVSFIISRIEYNDDLI